MATGGGYAEGERRTARGTWVVARRTRLRPTAEAAYEALHAAIPEPVLASLRQAGVVEWRIWRDGRTLLHVVETTEGYRAMFAAITALPPVDPAWDERVAALLEDAEAEHVLLGAVWGMDAHGQWGG